MNRLAKTAFGSLALVMVLAAVPPSATAQIQIFSTGGYGTPETISLAPSGFGQYGGFYFIPDARLGQIWVVPEAGGPPAPFLTETFPPTSLIGGLFLPSGWGDNSGKFLVATESLRIIDSAGNGAIFDPLTSGLTIPLIAPGGFGAYGGNLFVTDQVGFIWRADPAGGGLTLFKDLTGAPPPVPSPFGIEFTPSAFGSFGNRLLVSSGSSGSIAALAPDATLSPFATLPLADGQVGLRQMLMTPADYFLDSLGIPGRLLLLSITGSTNGGGTLGALVALDSTGTVVAHLREGGILAKFDPRGMVFTADGHLLISDTSDPIYLASALDFIAGPAAGALMALSPAHLWIGLKNSDDQGAQFDLKAELLRNGTPVASGLKRCVTGVTRNPDLAKEAVASFDPFTPVIVTSGDVLSLKVSARIGTNPDGTKCAGPGGSHNSAVGLRLYYDSASRTSRFDATITPNASEDLFLHSNGSPCPNGDGQSPGVTARTLDTTAPSSAKARCNDSGILNFAGGNPFSAIGTWSLAPLP